MQGMRERNTISHEEHAENMKRIALARRNMETLIETTKGQRDLPAGSIGILLHEGESGVAKARFGAATRYLTIDQYRRI